VVCSPFSESSKDTRTSTSTSAPRCPRCCCCCARPRPPPKRPPKMSPRSKSPKSNVVGPAPAPLRDPNVSYCLRFSGSDSTSYACWISLKRRSASASPGLRSGWYCRTSFRYAFLSSSADAFFATPSVSYSDSGIGPLAHDHPRRAQHALAEAVALLQNLDLGALVRVGGLREQRLLRVRVERPVRRDLDEALLRERVGEGAIHEPHTFLELCLLVLGGGLERALEIVEHGQELLHEPLGRTADEVGLVACDPLLVVLELGLETLERVEILVALPRQLRRVDRRRLLDASLFDGLRHQVALASSSTTS